MRLLLLFLVLVLVVSTVLCQKKTKKTKKPPKPTVPTPPTSNETCSLGSMNCIPDEYGCGACAVQAANMSGSVFSDADVNRMEEAFWDIYGCTDQVLRRMLFHIEPATTAIANQDNLMNAQLDILGLGMGLQCPVWCLRLRIECQFRYVALHFDGRWFMIVYIEGTFTQDITWWWCPNKPCLIKVKPPKKKGKKKIKPIGWAGTCVPNIVWVKYLVWGPASPTSNVHYVHWRWFQIMHGCACRPNFLNKDE